MRKGIQRFWRRALFAVAFLALFSHGCTVVTSHHAEDFDRSPTKANARRILLMPMDIELSTLTTGGLLKPEAEWTANAKKHVEAALRNRFEKNDIRLLSDNDSVTLQLTPVQADKRAQLIKLHEAVGQAILIHQYISYHSLPSKKDAFEWSLGPEASYLKERYGADCALFVYLRDSYASAGRVAFVIAAAALGVGMPMGQQTGFASLVELNTGKIVWFNRLLNSVGDLRTESAASKSVESLLSDFPL